MRWEGGKQSDNLQDRRRMSPRTAALGGGGLLLVLVIGTLLGVDPQKLKMLVNNAPAGGGRPVAAGKVDERPLTPKEKRTRDFAATILGFTEEVWDEQFRRAGKRYEKPKMVLFSDRVETGCGVAPSEVGPFYCPADRTVYLDPTFFAELEQKLGGSKAEFSQAYVIAHEIGHHVQNLLGYSELVEQKRRTLPKNQYNHWSVRLELQADYLAGVWAHYGQQRFNFIEPGDIDAAMTTARAIGDDRIQRNARGFTSPESYTHGTSEQRSKWFRLGLKTGDMTKLREIFELPTEKL
jgi:predicted metalloprotease